MKKIYFNYISLFLLIIISCSILSGCNHKFENESDEENDKYDGPDKAAEFERKRNTDPSTGEVSYRKMWDAVLETENLKNTNNSNSSSKIMAPLSWIERGSNSDAVGPSNGNTRPGGGVTSGRMRTVWVDLADPTGKTVWVGGISGGLWKTSDVTAAVPQWTLINDYLSNLAVSGICQDPTNTNTMYFCTGEAYFTGGGVGGVGVFKSTDHGITWTLLPSSSTLTRCTKILCDAAGNVYVSTMGISIAVGLQRSTNGGTSWVSINPFTTTSRIVDFEISSNGTMHVVGGLSSAAGIGGYKFSANPAASTPVWQSATTPYTIPTGNGARVEIACLANTVYAAISNTNKIDSVAKSIDGGLNWTTTGLTATNVTDLNGAQGQGTYSNGIIIDPSDPNTVIIGSLRLLKSTDGGITFDKISEWVGTIGQYVHADIHNMAWYDNGNKLIVGTDGGLFYSNNKGSIFSDKNTGIRIKQFYGVSIHPTSTNYFLAGAQDNGTHQFNGAGLTSSVEVLGGDGGITAIDQDEPLFQTGAYVYANFRRSSNGGASWISNGSASTSGQFINPYDFDNSGNKVYAGYDGQQYLRWEDPHSGFTFTPVNIPEFGFLPAPNSTVTASVASVTVSPYTANRVYFGLTNGKVFKIDNADQPTPTVTDITPAGTAPGYVNSVIIGISDQDLTVTLANAFSSSTISVWNTTNGGTSWTGIDGNLPEMPVYWALYHPDTDTKMYIATEAGVFSTDLINGTSTVWAAETTFPTVKTSMLKYRSSDRTIAASTYGRGLWTAIIPNSSCIPASISSQPTNVSICAGANTTFSITATGSAPLSYQWQVNTTGAGGPWMNLTNTAPHSNVTTATLNITAATVSLNNYQYRVIVTGNCAPLTATSNAATLIVNAVPAAPTANSSVTYCQLATSVPLMATGTNLLWYTVATGGSGSATAPTPSTATAGTTTYYVSQSNGTCESPRASITVTVNAAPPAPSITATLSYCQNSPAPQLSATGTNLLWYTSSTGGVGNTTAPTPNTATVGSTIYYVSQSNGNCEGPRASITVNITATPPAPTVNPSIQYCQNVSAVPLTASGSNLLWYSTSTGGTFSTIAPTPSTATVGSTVYYVSQTTGCESPRASITVNVVAGSPAPTSTSTTISYCQGSNALPLSATGSNLLWYTTATGGTGSTTAPTPSTATPGTTIYYVSQTNGSCESPRLAITLTITETPAAPTVSSPVNYCQNATATALTAGGTNLLWYTSATGGLGSTAVPTPRTTTISSTTYYVSQSSATCEGPRAAIVVNISAVTSAPTVTSPVTYCQGAIATALTATGTGLLWYTSSTGGTGLSSAPIPSTTAAGNTTYFVSQTSNCGESPRATIVVTVNPTPAAPMVTANVTYCQGNTSTALTATGTGLLWYTAATVGTGTSTAPTPSTTTAGTTTYYVSQTTGTCESQRSAITVTVSAGPAITMQPTDITSCTTSATFSVNANGTNLTYQWQVSTDGGLSYTNVTGATNSRYTVSGLTPPQANFKYRVVVSAAVCSSATSNAVTAKVGISPSVVLATSPTLNFNPFTNGSLLATVSPVGNYTYQWKRNNVLLPLVTGTSITKANGLLDGFGIYQVTVIDIATDCSGLSNTVTVSDFSGERNRLYLSPNPTRGIVKLSFYSSSSTTQGKMISVYDSKGGTVMTKQFFVSGNYGSGEVDLNKMSGGTYLFILRDASGKKIASGSVIKY